MFTENHKPRARGRPAGRTLEGEAARARLYRAAIALIGERGYDQATLRDVAARAGVSPALLYKYFPNKRAVVLALYDDLSTEFAAKAEAVPAGPWRERFMFTLELSLAVLGPHRLTLQALVPAFVGHRDDGVFAPATIAARARVQQAFVRAVTGARDAPRALAPPLGRILYLAQLGVILWWLLDRSPGQRATRALLTLTRGLLPSAGLALRLPPVRRFVESLDVLANDALLDTERPQLADAVKA